MKLTKLNELIELYGAQTTLGELLELTGGSKCN